MRARRYAQAAAPAGERHKDRNTSTNKVLLQDPLHKVGGQNVRRGLVYIYIYIACACAWGWCGRTYTSSQVAGTRTVRYPFPQHQTLLPKGVSSQPVTDCARPVFAELRHERATDNGDHVENAAFVGNGGGRATQYEAAPERSVQFPPLHTFRGCACLDCSPLVSPDIFMVCVCLLS